MKKIHVIVLVLIAVGAIGAGIALTHKSRAKEEAMEKGASQVAQSESGSDNPLLSVPTDETFTVVGGNFSFAPNEMKVKKGEKVKVIFKNNEGFHDFKIDEFNVATKRVKAGQQDVVIFTADKAGTFEYYCSVGTHRQMGMKGNLIVE